MDQFTQYLNIHAAVITTIIGLIVALIKSERMALNQGTAANGILHFFKLANQALATVQPVVAALEESPQDRPEPEADPPAIDNTVQIAALQSQLAALQSQLAALQAQGGN